MVKFIDHAKIYIKSGKGGNGCVSFRREKYIPRGGPNGGDGGNGGDVVFVARANMTSLLDFRYHQHYRARNGEHGKGKNQHGKSTPPLTIPVPLGTIIKDYSTDEVLADLTSDGESFVAARGGRGGKGNARFATSTNQAPKYAEPGGSGEEKTIALELKLIADVGIIGFPNAGKSTLISRMSAARPRIADYPFTTKVPNLGVVSYFDGKTFVVADIPGLIKGAHKGAGLGITFLKHIERTRVLIHLLDLSPFSERDPIEDFNAMNAELRAYNESLARRTQIIAVNKIDLEDARERLEQLQSLFAEREIKLYPVSALTGEGIGDLIAAAGGILEKEKKSG